MFNDIHIMYAGSGMSGWHPFLTMDAASSRKIQWRKAANILSAQYFAGFCCGLLTICGFEYGQLLFVNR
jgi:glycerol uptake facilitator-like aquaporin